MPQFVQLGSDECQYLIDLIKEMDSATAFTERQRSYTLPKLAKIQKDPRSARLYYQDVDYLLELIQDDDLEEFEQIRGMTAQTICQIRELQSARFEETKNIETQRELRKARRRGTSIVETQAELLQAKFAHAK